ncbi:hypothetical protein [Halorhabdus salina]|uniref:hypothetical protein n=1 Tax=Halorhabdus salina TaxID=2750670 RepID=UPI0015EE3BAB|nr:hypothetical protein [Halorhabdus salina]
MSESSSSAGIPSPTDLVGKYKNVPTAISKGLVGVVMAFIYLVVAPVQAGANSMWNIIVDFGDSIAAFMSSIPQGAADIITAGATETEQSLSGFTAFILALVLVFIAAWLFAFMRDQLDADIPFTGMRIPFLGDDEED